MEKFEFSQCEFQLLQLKIKSLKSLKVSIASESMEPWIRKGAEVTVQHINYNNLKACDIAVYFKDTMLICHVVFKVNANDFITKGIKSTKFDIPVQKENFLGIVQAPKFNWLQKFILKREFNKLWKSQI